MPSLSPFCASFHRAIELIGARWAGAILRALLAGPSRYGELRAAIPEINDRMLSERLKKLEQEGLVERRVIPETPIRVEYELTEKGMALEKAFRALAAWAEEWVDLEDSGSKSRAKKRG